MSLLKEREIIFRNMYPDLKKRVAKRFGHLRNHDDLLQLVSMHYAIALSEADLSKNYHAYCMQKGWWGCKYELEKENIELKASEFNEEFESKLHYDTGLINKNLHESPETECLLEIKLRRISSIFINLSCNERKTIEKRIFGFQKTVPNIKLRRQQMITKEFREKVREILCAA